MSPVFDEAKYRALLEKLEISEVNIADMNLNDRIDAEYFKRDSLMMLEKLRQLKNKKLEHFGDFVASAFYPAATQLYAIGDTPFIRCVDCINFPLMTHEQDSLFEKIPMEFVSNNGGINILHQGDIVITKVGSPCFASIIHEHEIVVLSRTVLGIKGIRNIDPYYLLVFLRSNYGFKQLLRQRELTIQYQLTLERVKQILVYTPSNILQNLIKTIVLRTFSFKQKSHDLYLSAQNLLLQDLGLTAWQPDDESVATKTFADFQTSGRLDAEYYQPKYDDLFKRISSYDKSRLGDIVNITKSIEPGSEAYQEDGVPFVRVSDITKFGITPPEIHLDRDKYYLENLTPKKDTILLSKDGSVGIAYKVENDLDVITSGALLHLTVKNNDFLPDYLTLVLNSIVVKLQAERDAGGSIIQHWKPSEIENVIIPKLPKAVQNQIAEKVRESFALRKESKCLLDLAKHAVEVAIEQGEDAAMKLLEDVNGIH